MLRRCPGSAGELEGFEVEGEVADDGVVEPLGAGAVELHVVRGPADTELVAAGRELADEVGEAFVVGVASGCGAQDGDGVVGDGVPVDEELGGLRAEEQEPCDVDRTRAGSRRPASRAASPSRLAARMSRRSLRT